VRSHGATETGVRLALRTPGKPLALLRDDLSAGAVTVTSGRRNGAVKGANHLIHNRLELSGDAASMTLGNETGRQIVKKTAADLPSRR